MSRRVLGLIVATIAIIVAAAAFTAWRLVVWHHRGYAGINAYVNPEKPAERKKTTSPLLQNGRVMGAMPQSAAGKAGLKSADIILSVNGIPLDDHERLLQLDARSKSGDRLVYRVRRNDTEIDIPITLASPIAEPMFIVSLVISGVVAIVYAAIGLLVLTRRPDDKRVVVFHAMSLVGAASVMLMNAFLFDSTNMRGIAFGTQNTVGFGVMATFGLAAFPLTLHLALIFPKERPIVVARPYVIRWVYALTIVAGVGLMLFMFGVQYFNDTVRQGSAYSFGRLLATASKIVALAGLLMAFRIAWLGRREGVRQAFLRRPLQSMIAALAAVETLALTLHYVGLKGAAALTLFLAVIVFTAMVLSYPVLTCIALYRSYRDANAEEKRQVRWPLWGLLIAISIKILITIVGVVAGIMFAMNAQWSAAFLNAMDVMNLIPRLASLLIPVSFAFAILKYRLMNIDVIIKKTVSYTILSGMIVVLYLILVGGLGTILVRAAGVQSQTMVIASTLVVALLFVPIRNRLQTLVDRNLFRERVDYPQALRTLAADTLAATDLIAFLGTSAETIQQALQNRAVVIFARRHDELVASAKVGVPDSVLGAVRMDVESAEGVDRPLDPTRRPLAAPATEAFKKVGATFVVPMRSRGTLHGILALAPKLSDREFDLEDLEFASSAADQMAIAIDRIRLRFEEEDFEQARAMQQALLPSSVPAIAGVEIAGTWKPARAVGGDYYDLLKLSDTMAGICIGDVAGKGMPAALLMSALQAAVRASATETVQPKELCERVRRVVVPSLAGGRFVTFFYCTVDTATKRILYCNAGHNPPILVRASGETLRLDVGGSVLSRLFRNENFQQGEFPLEEGDRLVLFTDGVSESRDASGSDYGEDRLEQLVVDRRADTARELLTDIVDEVTAFSGGRTDDDLTLVTVAVTLPA